MMYKNSILYALTFLSILGLYQRANPKPNLIGKKAPVFKAQAVNQQGGVYDFDLDDLKGKSVVLYFYPMDNTPGCSKQAQIFRDNIALLDSKNIVVVGIGCDSIKSHKKFQENKGLPFSLVSDSRWKQTISRLYGAAGWFSSKRKTFLIDEKGTVVKSFDKVDIQNQIEDILKAFNK